MPPRVEVRFRTKENRFGESRRKPMKGGGSMTMPELVTDEERMEFLPLAGARDGRARR